VNIEVLREYCISKPGVTEGFPFGEDTLVFKVGGKMFLLIGLSEADRFNVKCDPEWQLSYANNTMKCKPGYHMNKVHWNTVHIDGNLTEKQLREMMDHSYALVFKSLSKILQAEISA
jgi:predicted DNA-binding protein (MmcQ/YjbR family)